MYQTPPPDDPDKPPPLIDRQTGYVNLRLLYPWIVLIVVIGIPLLYWGARLLIEHLF